MILLTLASASCAILLLLDLSAVFDTVAHSVLMKWLKCEFGIQGLVLKWFEYLLKAITMSSNNYILLYKVFHKVPHWPRFTLLALYFFSLGAPFQKHGIA